MANITINEISQSYTYNTGNASYATVALPITSCWGPGYFDPKTYYGDNLGTDVDARDYMLEHTSWMRFPATQAGMQAFVSTFRGPASNYRLSKDFSYHQALTLLSSGYDVLVCRICPGKHASGKLAQKGGGTVTLRAKYPGTFGNNLHVALKKRSYFDPEYNTRKYYWSAITYIVDSSGVKTSVENISFVFNIENASDEVLYYKEVESKYFEITNVEGKMIESAEGETPLWNDKPYVHLGHESVDAGTDFDVDNVPTPEKLSAVVKARYDWAIKYAGGDASTYKYVDAVKALSAKLDDQTKKLLYAKEWIYTEAVLGVYDLLKDKLSYSPNRVISPGWDDQNFYLYEEDAANLVEYIGDKTEKTCKIPVSPMHLKLMDVAYYSRCATAYIDIPKSVDRKFVHIEDETNTGRVGYAQLLARVSPVEDHYDINGTLFHTHSALFAPWGQFVYTGTRKMNEAPPSLIALLIQRAQILNQPIQYEWALPTSRRHHLRVGKLDYTVQKKVLDRWQKLEGVGVNVIANIPGLGINIWGNSTLFEVPPVTYQALANLSTRHLVNAVEDVIYKCGLAITFQYNNQQAYNKFYAGCTPILDTMQNVGAIEGYKIEMSSDIRGIDHVNANSVIGKVYIWVNGVIENITVDLICLPPGVDAL